MNSQPDVEIYIKHLDCEQFIHWLTSHFDQVDEAEIKSMDMNSPRSYSTAVINEGHSIELVVTPCAAGKAYTSIWFKSPHTPWPNDLACAESALELMDTEVRCSAESWAEEEPEFSEKWWKITRETRELVVWG